MKPIRTERVKVVATIGPASSRPAVLRGLIAAGVDAVRLNASHVEPGEVAAWVGRIRRASRAVKTEVAVLLDLQGVKFRIGDLSGPRRLAEGDRILLAARESADSIPVRLRRILPHLRKGADIFLQDGFLRLEVVEVRATEVECRVLRGGLLKSRAGLNLPDVRLPARIPTRRDLEHMRAGIAAGVDLFALSFVRSALDLDRCRRHAEGVPIVAKIELPEAVEAIESIASASDGILVARGDLAVEMEPEMLPVLQKSLIAAANRARKPVIVATEMLASMVTSPRPTRAELTDVGNAVLDGADAAMLSDETAIGRDPERAVRYLTRIIAAIEGSLMRYDLGVRRRRRGEAASRPDWAIADAAVDVAANIGAQAIVAFTGSGRTARLISSRRPSVPIYCVAPEPAVRRRVALMWGVSAGTVRPIRDVEKLTAHVLGRLRKAGYLAAGDRVVIAFGSPLWGEGTKTNTVRIAHA